MEEESRPQEVQGTAGVNLHSSNAGLMSIVPAINFNHGELKQLSGA